MTASAFNTLIGANPTVHPQSAAIMANLPGVGNILAGNSTNGVSSGYLDYDHPLYFGATTDPLFTLNATGYAPSIPSGTQIRIPDAAKPANGLDGHMCVVTPDGYEYDFYQVTSKPAGGGTLTFVNGGRLLITGPGNSNGATAPGFGLLAGVIRPEELIGGQINHALFFTLPGGSSALDFGYGVLAGNPGDGNFVAPAQNGDAIRTGANQLPMGGRLQLNMTDAQIAALSAQPWQKTIMTALAHYGGYFGDTSGANAISFQFLSGQTYTSFGITDPLITFGNANPAQISVYTGIYTYQLSTVISWASNLRVLAPIGY